MKCISDFPRTIYCRSMFFELFLADQYETYLSLIGVCGLNRTDTKGAIAF